MKKSFRTPVLLGCIALGCLLGYRLFQKTPEPNASARTEKPTPAKGQSASQMVSPASSEFKSWLKQARPLDPVQLQQGMELAKRHGDAIKILIQTDPERAIRESLSYEEWSTLPEEMQRVVEQPYSAKANYNYYPVCVPEGQQRTAGTPEYVATLDLEDGSSLDAYVYGKRLGMMSKKQLPVQGIRIDGLTAIREETFQQVELNPTILSLFRENGDGGKSLLTGKPVGSQAVHAVAGGQLFTFATEEELDQANTTMARLDEKPGRTSAGSLLYLPYGSTGSFTLSTAESFAAVEASAWTESKKKVFLIRVNFTDNTAEPVTQAAATTELNGPTSTMIQQMSYGKTWIEGTVSANLYTMPQTASYYANSGSSKNDELLRDARNKFRNTKSGGDATINIGPVNTSGNGDGGGLGNYDIVGVFFSSIGMYSGGINYAGLAGGGNLWVQNANYTSLYTHELGHNYGLGHASFWQTSDNSVAGTGSSVEYGDPFDVMGGGPAVTGHYHAQGKAKLNWLTASQWTDATASGSNTYRIYREDDPATTGTTRGVRATKSSSTSEYYWINYKPAFSTNPHMTRGAYINWQRSGETRCWLLDFTPATSGVTQDAPLDLGRTYADATAGVYITPLATGGSGADSYLDVRVNVGSFSGNTAPVASSISGVAALNARSAAAYSANATDANGDTLAYYWNFGDGAVNDNTSSLSHSWTVGGSYNISLQVSDMKGGTSTVTKAVTVTDPIDTWTQNTISGTNYLTDVVWAKGRFVVAEYFGDVYTSWNGTTWSGPISVPSFDKEPCLAFGSDVFVMAGKIDNLSAGQIC
jgi:PKD domain/Peptidase M66